MSEQAPPTWEKIFHENGEIALKAMTAACEVWLRAAAVLTPPRAVTVRWYPNGEVWGKIEGWEWNHFPDSGHT